MKVERKPYVVSEDIHILLAEWAKKREFVMPSPVFFKGLRQTMQEELTEIFGAGNVEMIAASRISREIRKLVQRTGLEPVSMDKVYLSTDPSIKVARIMNRSLKDCGLGPRFGALAVQEQLLSIKASEIVLVDDVLFSGRVITEIISFLEKIGVKVPKIVAGIAIGEGKTRIQEKTKTEVLSARYYQEVIDEICERDFYPGVPLSGRLIAGTKVETGAPYLEPFGKPREWASIPQEKTFSRFCLLQTISLWEEIERLSQKTVRCCDLERIPLGISHNRARFIDCLKFLL